MKKREKIITIAVTAASVLFLVGVTALAAGVFGSQSDPLVTLSYINDTVKPDVEKYASKAVADLKDELADDFDDKLDEFSDDLTKKLDDATVADEADIFVEVTLNNGETVTCGIGAELMLREGSVETSGITLADLSSGTDATGALEVNHMYVVTRNGDITATSGDTMLLIKGEYTIG